MMNYIPNTDQDRQRMLDAIGVSSVEALFADIPAEVRLGRKMDLPQGMSEAELFDLMRALASRNANAANYVSFLGAGAYDHYVPAVVNHVLNRSEFYTAYTPYQPEVSQAVLQSIYEFQSMICELTGMTVANASMYDGATAMAEAAFIACSTTRRTKIAVSRTVHPEYRQVMATYAAGADRQVVEVGLDPTTGITDPKALDAALEDAACLLIQQPNFFGCLEEVNALAERAKASKALFIVAVDPISLGVLRPPGDYGADIVVGEGQPLGIPLSFGGPYLGFFAVTDRLMRRIPGRVVGMTTDTRGQRGFVLTLQTREQHIRRDKATSNICSNQALCALAATVYLSWLGKEGLRQLAELCLHKASYLKDQINRLPGYSAAFSSPSFREFAVRCPVAPEAVIEQMLAHQIIPGYALGKDYPELENLLLIAVTEQRSRQQLDALVSGLEGLA